MFAFIRAKEDGIAKIGARHLISCLFVSWTASAPACMQKRKPKQEVFLSRPAEPYNLSSAGGCLSSTRSFPNIPHREKLKQVSRDCKHNFSDGLSSLDSRHNLISSLRLSCLSLSCVLHTHPCVPITCLGRSIYIRMRDIFPRM